MRQSLNERLLPEAVRRLADNRSLRELLVTNDFEGLEALFRAVFAGIPYEWHTRNDIAHLRGVLRQRVLFLLRGAGIRPYPGEISARGRADMAFRFNGHVYLFEFKTVERTAEGAALAQLREQGYADKYRHLDEPIHLIGVEFSRAVRNIAAFAVERA